MKQYKRQWYKENQNRIVRSKYDLSLKQYDEMCARQDGLCAICKSKKQLVIDHDHKTGRVRGLLCKGCNSGIGLMRDGELFASAAAYLSLSTGKLQ